MEKHLEKQISSLALEQNKSMKGFQILVENNTSSWENNILSVGKNISSGEEKLKNKISSVEEKLENKISSVENKISSVENKISSVEETLKRILEIISK